MRKLLVLLLAFSPASLLAHDFWLEPSAFRPPPGSVVSVDLRVGDHFAGDSLARRAPNHVLRFEAHANGGIDDVEGRVGSKPAGTVMVKEGLTTLAYQSAHSYTELSEAKLKQYLREEGLESIHEVRARSPHARTPWREIYSRSAKSLLWSGGPQTGFDKPVGLPLEIVPERSPYAMKPGASLPVRLLLDGKPLSNAWLVAMPRSAPTQQVKVRTDANGRATLTLAEPGPWLIKSVHIMPAPTGSRGQWESIWASLTFELPR